MEELTNQHSLNLEIVLIRYGTVRLRWKTVERTTVCAFLRHFLRQTVINNGKLIESIKLFNRKHKLVVRVGL